MNWKIFKWVFLLTVTVNVNFITAVPANINRTREKDVKSSKYVEIKLPVKITSMEDLINWVKNAMQTMASRIDITLAADSSSSPVADLKNSETKAQVTENKMIMLKPEDREVEKNFQAKLPIPRSLPGFEYPFFRYENDVLPPLINADAYLPLFVGDFGNRYGLPNYGFNGLKKSYSENIRQETTTASPMKIVKIEDRNSAPINSTSGVTSPESVPFAIPFEAFITITREETDAAQNDEQAVTEKQPSEFKMEVTTAMPKKKKDSGRKRQIAVLGDILEALGLTRRPDKHKIETSATTTAGTKSKRPREEPLRPPIAFGEVSSRFA